MNQALSSMRPRYDNLLKTHALLLLLSNSSPDSEQYINLNEQLFELNRAKLRNYGLRLYVNYQDLPGEFISILQKSPFNLDNKRKAGFMIKYSFENNQHVLSFLSSSTKLGNIKVKGDSDEKVIEQFIDAVFVEEFAKKRT